MHQRRRRRRRMVRSMAPLPLRVRVGVTGITAGRRRMAPRVPATVTMAVTAAAMSGSAAASTTRRARVLGRWTVGVFLVMGSVLPARTMRVATSLMENEMDLVAQRRVRLDRSTNLVKELLRLRITRRTMRRLRRRRRVGVAALGDNVDSCRALTFERRQHLGDLLIGGNGDSVAFNIDVRHSSRCTVKAEPLPDEGGESDPRRGGLGLQRREPSLLIVDELERECSRHHESDGKKRETTGPPPFLCRQVRVTADKIKERRCSIVTSFGRCRQSPHAQHAAPGQRVVVP